MQIWFSKDTNYYWMEFSKGAIQTLLEKLFRGITPKTVFMYLKKKKKKVLFFTFKWLIMAVGIFHFYNMQEG